MIEDGDIPEGIDEKNARKFINNANQNIFYKKEISGKKKVSPPVFKDDESNKSNYNAWEVSKYISMAIIILVAFSMLIFCIGKFFTEIVFGLKW